MEEKITFEQIQKDPSWNQFIAIMLQPHGWVVLSPWIQTKDGYWYRHHIWNFGVGIKLCEDMAQHLANELNKYLK